VVIRSNRKIRQRPGVIPRLTRVERIDVLTFRATKPAGWRGYAGSLTGAIMASAPTT